MDKVFRALANQTMNSSVTPLIPSGSSISGASPLSASSSSNCARCTAGFFGEWLTTLQFPQGKEASGPRFGWTVCCLGPGGLRQLNQIFLFSLPGSPKVIQICSHLRSCLELGHHCLQLFRESSVKLIPLQFSYTFWQKTVWEGCC